MVTGDLLAARSCRAAAAAATAAGALLAAGQQWLAAFLVWWLVPSLLFVGGLARRAHSDRKEGRA